MAECLSFDYQTEKPTVGMDFFFQYPYLIELNLSDYPYFFIPLSISQCQLIERIDLTNTNFSEPPAVLFTLPQIRAHPENIIFGNNQKCSVDLMYNIIDECVHFNQGMLNFSETDGKISTISYSPEISTKDFILMAHPELEQFLPFIFLVRKFENNKLSIIPGNVPLILYQYPDSVWSIELRFLPTYISVDILPYLSLFLKNKSLLDLSEKVNSLKSPTQETLEHIFEKLQEDSFVSNYYFSAEMLDKRTFTISVTFNSISLAFGHSSYYVFDNRSIHLSYVTNVPLFVVGDRALILDPKSVPDLMPLFSLLEPVYPPKKHTPKKDFSKFAFKAIQISSQVKRKNRPIEGTGELIKNSVIFELSSIKSKMLPFTRVDDKK
ncbi:hypothetical protein TRFO_16504 [Tritrichomonas foetus]|uniref:Uncharacterized protein n=1 Tax=Tritrichomonas foetus TaxID=1144522 RepID=A0A1J4KPU5_9EUKA|nr:hypothetical protein TRFO_16504 [Tritrichomonas foetus]|eukprot:OHT13311.1 hypothetical protein TRFO_16504 [Tritrichomonas foetus]